MGTEINTTGRLETVDVLLEEDADEEEKSKQVNSDLEGNLDQSYNDDFSQTTQDQQINDSKNVSLLSPSSSSVKIVSLNDPTPTPSAKIDEKTVSLSSV